MKGSVYMRWAKDHAAARYNLANSGLLGCSKEDFPFEPEDLLINGPNRDGYPPLLEAIAARCGVTPDQVASAPGASGANFLAFSALVHAGDEVLVERPTYEPLLAALSFLGARVRRFERHLEDGWKPGPEEIRRQLADGRVRLVVMANPHNPSGVFLSPEEMGEIARVTADAGATLLVDEVYQDIWPGARSHVHLGDNVVATSSLTKCYGLSGLRCGWILASPELTDRMRKVKDLMEAVDSVPSESLAVAAFRHLPHFEARSRAILDSNIARIRAFLAEHVEWIEAVLPERAMCVFSRLKKEEDSEPLHDWLRGRETSIVPGKFFEDPRFFRLGFAVKPEDVAVGLENLSEGLRRGFR